MRRIAFAVAMALGCAGLSLGGLRVVQLERGELELETPWRSLNELAHAPGSSAVSARLAEVELARGERALVEVCWRGGLGAEHGLGGLEFAVFEQAPMRLMLRVPLDEAHLDSIQRDAAMACLRLGQGTAPRTGRYTVDAIWPDGPPSAIARSQPLGVRVLARTPLSSLDRGSVITLALGVVVALLTAVLLPSRREAAGFDSPQLVPARQLALAIVSLLAVAGTTELPAAGAASGLLKGAGLTVLQIGLALWLAGGLASSRSSALAIRAVSRPGCALAAALLVAVLLVVSARLALHLIPATSRAPIQSFVSWPSGLLCFALLGVLLPVGEELFFRGYLYRSALVLFIALHLRQSWGNWGGVMAVAITGVALTTLRVCSGSTLVSALAHVLYNLALSLAAL
jgi:membrane protease YdiL (CAAX protease family)